jgi:hypothetical protein
VLLGLPLEVVDRTTAALVRRGRIVLTGTDRWQLAR